MPYPLVNGTYTKNRVLSTYAPRNAVLLSLTVEHIKKGA